ncbi:MAG: MFS transporter [Gemmataceae bacterium]
MIESPATAPASRPKLTHSKYFVLILLCLLAMITYMDRAANGSAKKAIMADLGVNADQFFYVLMAFQLAYALFEIPSGWLGDTRGPRSTLLRVVLWWSIFVALTGFTATTIPFTGIYIGFYGLIVIQFLFGVGEAGAFPNIAKALYNWFPASERGFAKSAVWMAARWMGGLTPVIWILLTEVSGLSWRQAMWLFAAVAAVWCVVFALTFRNHPPKVEAEQLLRPAPAPSVPLLQLWSSPNLWAICAMYIVTNFCWYFLMYYLPGEMAKEFKDWGETTKGKLLIALLSGSPLLIGSFGCLLGGTLSDRLIRRTGNRKWGRRIVGMIGYGGAGMCYLAAAAVLYYDPKNLFLFAFFLVLMGFMNDLIMAPAWAVCQDVGQQYAATVSGTMNMVGNLLGAVTGIFVTGHLTKAYPGTNGILICFGLYSFVYFCGVIAWLFIDASRPLIPSANQDDAKT